MGLLRRDSTRIEPATPAGLDPARAAEYQRAIDNPDTTSFKRRALRRRLAGVVAVGPSGPPAPQPEPPSAELAAAALAEHNTTVRIELARIDRHARTIEARLGALARHDDSHESSELRRELAQLRELRSMIAADLDRPILADRDGRRVLTDEDRGHVEARAAEIRESHWRAAERHARAGEHREARRHRVDSLRSRQISEYEAGLRPSLLGFGRLMWG